MTFAEWAKPSDFEFFIQHPGSKYKTLGEDTVAVVERGRGVTALFQNREDAKAFLLLKYLDQEGSNNETHP